MKKVIGIVVGFALNFALISGAMAFRGDYQPGTPGVITAPEPGFVCNGTRCYDQRDYPPYIRWP